jgi:hypothetical protein
MIAGLLTAAHAAHAAARLNFFGDDAHLGDARNEEWRCLRCTTSSIWNG